MYWHSSSLTFQLLSHLEKRAMLCTVPTKAYAGQVNLGLALHKTCSTLSPCSEATAVWAGLPAETQKWIRQIAEAWQILDKGLFADIPAFWRQQSGNDDMLKSVFELCWLSGQIFYILSKCKKITYVKGTESISLWQTKTCLYNDTGTGSFLLF